MLISKSFSAHDLPDGGSRFACLHFPVPRKTYFSLPDQQGHALMITRGIFRKPFSVSSQERR